MEILDMDKDVLWALIAHYTKEHHDAEEGYENAHNGDEAQFYLYIRSSALKELRKLQKMYGEPR